MLTSLHSRVAAALLGLLLLAGAAWLASTLITTRLYQREAEQTLHWDLARRLAEDQRSILVTPEGVTPEGELSPAGLDDLFHWLMVVNPSVEFYLLDAEGEILAYDAPPGVVKTDRVAMGPVREALAPGAGPPLLGDDPRNPGEPTIFSVAPLPLGAGAGDGPAGAEPEGYLYIVLASQLAESAAERLRGSWVLRQAVWIALACLALAGLAGALLSRRLTRPLRALAERMRAFRASGGGGGDDGSDGGGGQRAADGDAAGNEDGTFDEVAALAARFRELEERVRGQEAERERLESMRRDLIANVSHDLRTPIAALRGYLETLALKGDAVSPERREEYLAIALRHAERLGRLVAELFELTTLESAEARIEAEPFSIAELVQDNLQRFALTAGERGIQLTADLDPSLPRVEADVGLVERVLENLLDNALRHTSAGGEVVVGLEPCDGRIRVRVTDSGEGIAEHDLPHVFDRYFRSAEAGSASAAAADGGRTNGAGVGLGLAISRRIAELHGSPLEVRSRPGEGAEFSFSLATVGRRAEGGSGPRRAAS